MYPMLLNYIYLYKVYLQFIVRKKVFSLNFDFNDRQIAW